MSDDPTGTSRLLSRVLRHQPERIGLTLDAGGWADIDTLLRRVGEQGRALTRADLETLVARSDKQRFAISADGRRIRANQGHSIPVELDLRPVEPPAVLFHGTAKRFLEPILAQGLLKRGRQHVHLSAAPGTAVAVGRRHGDPLVLEVDAAAMYAAGLDFFQSANGVWLTDAVPNRYLKPQRQG